MLQFDCHCLPGGGTENVRKYTESSKAYYYYAAIMKYRAFTENLLKMQESTMTRASSALVAFASAQFCQFALRKKISLDITIWWWS